MTEEEFHHYEAYLNYDISEYSKIHMSVRINSEGHKRGLTINITDDITGAQLKALIRRSQERFINHVLEHSPGALPLWENTSNENTCSS